MPVSLSDIVPGSVFQFKTGTRRVLSIQGDKVVWEWEDGDVDCKRVRRGGSMWIKSFAEDAHCLPGEGEQSLKLLSGEVVKVLNTVATFKLRTLCPSKYLVIDMESGAVMGIGKSGLERVPVEKVSAAKRVLLLAESNKVKRSA